MYSEPPTTAGQDLPLENTNIQTGQTRTFIHSDLQWHTCSIISKTKDQQQDNTIQSNTTSINANTNSINTLNQQVANNKNLLDQTIDGLRTLKPFEYVGEYQNGTSYKINQLVSYNNNLYLSKEDNNNTTPTSDK